MNIALEKKEELLTILSKSLVDFDTISESEWNFKNLPHKWSKKEILGHLIDSASNNMRRLIIGQYEQGTKIIYRQDEWVALQGYQNAKIKDLILLWLLLNEQFARVLDGLPSDRLQHVCDTGKEKVDMHTLAYFIEDYIVHLNYHLKQINAKEL